jgi:hypothetical protein
MNIISEQREQIITENNTAQSALLFLLDKLNTQTDTIEINYKIHGDLDFKILTERGFNLVTKIVITEGSVTNVSNLPNGIIHFECNNNLLINLEEIPLSLEVLTIDYNYIDNINVSYLTKLRELNISHNKLTDLESLPLSLEILNCEFNSITRLDLDKLKLKNLNISNNLISIIENLSENIVQFSYDNNPSIEFRNKNEHVDIPKNATQLIDDVQLKYIEALHEYYKLKNTYMTKLRYTKHTLYKRETNQRQRRQAMARIKSPCIKCKRNVDTIFTSKNNRHIAVCGDTKDPCTLNIQLFNGSDNVSIFELLDDLKTTVDEIKQSTIQHKLDTLFNYISVEQSLQLYNTELEEFNTISAIYKEYIDMYNDLYNNPTTRALIDKKMTETYKRIEETRDILSQYDMSNASKNKELIQNVVDTQINHILPEMFNVRLLKYDINEVIKDEYKLGVYNYVLHQRDVNPIKDFIYTGEPPRVIHFVK